MRKTTKTQTTAYDVTEYLRTPEDMAAYLDAWLEEDGEIYVRVITARKATRHEIKGYETGDERYLG